MADQWEGGLQEKLSRLQFFFPLFALNAFFIKSNCTVHVAACQGPAGYVHFWRVVCVFYKGHYLEAACWMPAVQ